MVPEKNNIQLIWRFKFLKVKFYHLGAKIKLTSNMVMSKKNSHAFFQLNWMKTARLLINKMRELRYNFSKNNNAHNFVSTIATHFQGQKV